MKTIFEDDHKNFGDQAKVGFKDIILHPQEIASRLNRFVCCILLGACMTASATSTNAPCHFIVPGHEAEMGRLNELLDLHRVRWPAATPWDQWIPRSVLWPDVQKEPSVEALRAMYRDLLPSRRMDTEGYVSTHQHQGYGHSEGWPFPLWNQGGGMGWHFLPLQLPKEWAPVTTTTNGWTLEHARTESCSTETGLVVRLLDADAALTTPPMQVKALVAPFIRLQWDAKALLSNAMCAVQWKTNGMSTFDEMHRVQFSPGDGIVYGAYSYVNIPIYRSKAYCPDDSITGLRFSFPAASAATIVIDGINTAMDSRHNVNNSAYVRGCVDYAEWSGDIGFVRANIGRLRTAIRYCMTEFGAQERKLILAPWVGHDGRSGIEPAPNKKILHGLGIGNNYWDLLPFGGKDCLATIYYYDALLALTELEEAARTHPDWSIPHGKDSFDPAALRRHAAEVKAHAGRVFWNDKTGRFVAAIDCNGTAWDFGYTFVNLEAIHYGFATDAQARSILSWISGERTVEGDTSRGADIYWWRCAPRASTRRNIEWYTFGWNGPESLEFGGQVQDGGGVLGFSYFDLMSRLRVLGPDNAWQRLREIIAWFDDVQREGGYAPYYSKPGRGKLQGGTYGPGGLGVDCEFIESVMVPKVMLYGFMGFAPGLDGFTLEPNLPTNWPSLRIEKILFHDAHLNIEAERDKLTIECASAPSRPLTVRLPRATWTVTIKDLNGSARSRTVSPDSTGIVSVPLTAGTLRLERVGTDVRAAVSPGGSRAPRPERGRTPEEPL